MSFPAKLLCQCGSNISAAYNYYLHPLLLSVGSLIYSVTIPYYTVSHYSRIFGFCKLLFLPSFSGLRTIFHLAQKTLFSYNKSILILEELP